MRVYHLLSANWALSNIKRRRLKISFFEDLNDPFEFLAFETSDASLRVALGSIPSTLAKTRGVLCFSRSWANPVLWSHYGDKHKGIALGFDIPNLINGDRPWFEVTYVRERLKCTFEELSRWSEPDVHKLLATKFEHWSYEDEVRVFTSIEEKDEDSGLCFVPFSESLPLVEAVLGVRCSVPPQEVQEALAGITPSVQVVEGMLDERTFSVVCKPA